MADLTDNKDIDYIEKDFSSVVDGLITFANVNFGPGTSANRLWTDFNADSFSRNWLEIVAFVSDVFFFYFDNQATQSYLQTATVRSAINDIAEQFGFTPASATSASGDATFTVTGAVTIPRGFKVRASNGADFFVTDPINAVSAGDVTGTVLQGIIKSEQFTAEGLQNEELELQGPNIIRDSNASNPSDISPRVTVNGNTYDLVDSFIRHNGEDSAAITDSLGNIIGGGGRVFTLDERPDGTPFITFGDGIFGRKLSAGENVTVTYRTGGGSVGNISEETLNTLIDTLPQVTAVTNNDEFSGGADEQSIDQLRELIPASLRTLDRAVSEQDYSDLLVATFSEVFAASTEVNNTDPGIDINIYVVPQGSGITSITANSSLSTRLTEYIDRRKMVTVQFQILDAFGVDTLIDLEVFVSSTASRSTVTSAIETALLEYFDLSTGGSDGAGIGFAENILLKDINDIVSAINGVERFEIKQLSYRPRIEQNIVGLTTTYNTSEVTIFENVTESEWLIGATGVDTRVGGTVLFDNTGLTAYTYTSSTGLLEYAFPVDLRDVAPGDLFRGGSGTEEVTEVTTVADVAGSLNDTYWLLNSPTTEYYVWYNVSGGGTDPSIGGKTGIEVAISTNDTANDVASATQSAIDSESDFAASVSTNVVTVTNAAVGSVADAEDGASATGFSFNVTTQGISADIDYTILGVDTENSTLLLAEDLTVDENVTTSDNGSVRSGATEFQSFKAFRKIRATATNLSIDSITDNNLDLTVKQGEGVALSSTVLLDNSTVFVPDKYSTGDFYLVDSQSHIWEIEENDSNTITTSLTAVDDASIVAVSEGEYRIVQKMTGNQIVFADSVFTIQYNTHNTVFSIGGQFSQIGTIGDDFEISIEQQNTGELGASLDLVSYDDSTGKLRLNSAPDLTGINADFVVIDSSGQVMNVIGTDNAGKPSVFYDEVNKDTDFVLEDSGLGSQVAQGFEVLEDDNYPVVSMYLQREGNIVGNLTARIVEDDGSGLPDTSSVVATSETISITESVPTSYDKVLFSFTTPPSLTTGTQYHLVLSADAAYAGAEQSGVKSFDNTGLVGFTYNASNGIVEFSSAVSLTNVEPGHYFQDSSGDLYLISAVSDTDDQITIPSGLSIDTSVPSTSDDGSVIINDRILIGTDESSPTYANGEFSRFDGTLWSNSTDGPSPSGTDTDAIFSVEGTKTITVDTNLDPELGPGATVSKRYYDDEGQISLIIGISAGSITSAADFSPNGLGTVASVPNRPVDNFVFRTSRNADDIVNLRANEIPQLSVDDINIRIFGGVE